MFIAGEHDYHSEIGHLVIIKCSTAISEQPRYLRVVFNEVLAERLCII